MKFNPEINRRRSIRLHGRDYSTPGKYFLTICANGRELIFGTIENKTLILSPIGNIAERYWENIPRHFSNIRLDEYCIMPNHIHGILIIEDTINVGVQYETNRDHIEPLQSHPQFHSFQHMVPKSIGSIIRTYKTAVTKTLQRKWFQSMHLAKKFL